MGTSLGVWVPSVMQVCTFISSAFGNRVTSCVMSTKKTPSICLQSVDRESKEKKKKKHQMTATEFPFLLPFVKRRKTLTPT